jgi:hypothetical protein
MTVIQRNGLIRVSRFGKKGGEREVTSRHLFCLQLSLYLPVYKNIQLAHPETHKSKPKTIHQSFNNHQYFKYIAIIKTENQP